jgi:hypothetical protein
MVNRVEDGSLKVQSVFDSTGRSTTTVSWSVDRHSLALQQGGVSLVIVAVLLFSCFLYLPEFEIVSQIVSLAILTIGVGLCFALWWKMKKESNAERIEISQAGIKVSQAILFSALDDDRESTNLFWALLFSKRKNIHVPLSLNPLFRIKTDQLWIISMEQEVALLSGRFDVLLEIEKVCNDAINITTKR